MATGCTNLLDADGASPAVMTETGHPPHDPRDLVAANRRQCGWCTGTFAIARRPGRPRIYCSQACRQRAYERRRGLGVLPPPDRLYTRPGGPLVHLSPQPGRYEGGRAAGVTGKLHAMRPADVADPVGRRLTLCGLLAHTTTRPFSPLYDDACSTCARVSHVRPAGRPIRISNDLAALRSMLDGAAVELSRRVPSRPPEQILREILRAA
jgi:hypothetical protein